MSKVPIRSKAGKKPNPKRKVGVGHGAGVKGVSNPDTPSSEPAKPEAPGRDPARPKPHRLTVSDLYRMTLGLDADGRTGPIDGRMGHPEALAHVLGTSPIQALRDVREDAMAIVRWMAEPELDMDRDDRICAANALWRALDRLEVTTEFLRRGLDAHAALYS